jgi:hypothetical protein
MKLRKRVFLDETPFRLHKSKEFDRTSYCKYYIMSILSVGDIESRGAIFYFVY